MSKKSSQAQVPDYTRNKNINAKNELVILAPISLGELLDKITILEIKCEHFDGIKLTNTQKELEALQENLEKLKVDIDRNIIKLLKETNRSLWQIEDDIRDKEQLREFDEAFIQLARSVYRQNDRRAAIKREINTNYGSAFVEEKSYKDY